MICTGVMGKNSLKRETKFINEDGQEIFYGYRNQFAPLKMMISGCSGRYNYIGETQHFDGKTSYSLFNGEQLIMQMEKRKSMRPACDIKVSDRELEVKFAIGLGSAKTSIIEDKQELAAMTVRRGGYTLEIKDSENPTLMVSILLGAAEVNGFTGELCD